MAIGTNNNFEAERFSSIYHFFFKHKSFSFEMKLVHLLRRYYYRGASSISSQHWAQSSLSIITMHHNASCNINEGMKSICKTFEYNRPGFHIHLHVHLNGFVVGKTNYMNINYHKQWNDTFCNKTIAWRRKLKEHCIFKVASHVCYSALNELLLSSTIQINNYSTTMLLIFWLSLFICMLWLPVIRIATFNCMGSMTGKKPRNRTSGIGREYWIRRQTDIDQQCLVFNWRF